MTTRERSLATIVGATLGVLAIGFLAYQFVLSPWLEKNRLIKQRQLEVTRIEMEIDDILLKKKKFEAARQQSLPSDAGVSRLQYSNLLNSLLRRADYAPGTYRITVGEADAKTAPPIAPKRPAYTRLNYELTLKGELYHLVDFMRMFYNQPLLHQIKKINIQRPSDARQRGRNELDVTMSIEALVLDGAPTRPTLLPVVREIALLSGAAAVTGYNMRAVAEGSGSPIPPTGVLAESAREYLAIAGKNVFFGPPPVKKDRVEDTREEDISPFITLVSIVGHDDDGTIVAMFRDKLFNNDYTITQKPDGSLTVKGEYELNGRMRLMSAYSIRYPSRDIIYGTTEGENRKVWRVRRVTFDGVIVEKVDPETADKPKPPALAGIAGGVGAYVAVPDGKVYKVTLGQCLDVYARANGRGSPPPTRYLLNREAWKEIYAPHPTPAIAVSGGSRGR